MIKYVIMLFVICHLNFVSSQESLIEYDYLIANKTLIKSSDDYVLVNSIIKKNKTQDIDKTLVFNLDNNNEYIISILENLEKFESDNNIHKSDSLKQSIGINNKLILDSIFNKKQYRYLISQKHKSKWNLELIDKSYLTKTSSSFNNYIKISKPIYTVDEKFALISINKETQSGIYIFKKIDANWVEYKLIAPIITQPSAKKFMYKN